MKETLKKTSIDLLKSKSLQEAAIKTIKTIQLIPINQDTTQTIFRENYEAIRQASEAAGYANGYQCSTHEAITRLLTLLGEKTFQKNSNSTES